jgi:hypothetical protein
MIYVSAAWRLVKALPEWAWWIAAILALIAAAFAFDFFNDRAAVAEADAKRVQASIPAVNQSAEERADDAIRNVMAEKEREAAIAKAELADAQRAPEERSTVSAQDQALNCARLRQAGLTDGQKYKELCQ